MVYIFKEMLYIHHSLAKYRVFLLLVLLISSDEGKIPTKKCFTDSKERGRGYLRNIDRVGQFIDVFQWTLDSVKNAPHDT